MLNTLASPAVALAGSVVAGMCAANIAVIILKLTKHSDIAQRVAKEAYRLTWPLRLGDGDYRK